MRWAEPGAAYVPFIGDGDIARELYADRMIYGADLDPERVAIADEHLPNAQILVGDCDHWLFDGIGEDIVLADFDAYANPYTSFRAFWEEAPKRDRLLLFFTDGERLAMNLRGKLGFYGPDGTLIKIEDPQRRRTLGNHYLSTFIWPWFEEYIAGWRILERYRYLRGGMVYWGAAIERASGA